MSDTINSPMKIEFVLMCISFFLLLFFSTNFGMQSEYLEIMVGLNESHATVVVNQFTFRYFLYEFITQRLKGQIHFFYCI